MADPVSNGRRPTPTRGSRPQQQPANTLLQPRPLPSPVPPTDATEEDVIGAILCPNVAARLLDLPVVFTFPRAGDFSGRVISNACMEHLGGAYLHKVLFDDGDEADYPFDTILRAHEHYMRLNSADLSRNLRKPVQFNRRQTLSEPHPTLAPAQFGEDITLDLPPSLLNYPIRLLFNGSMVQGQLTHRRVTATGEHKYTVQLPAPHSDITHTIDTATLHACVKQARTAGIAAPVRSIPELTPVRDGNPVVDGSTWTVHHPLVRTTVLINLTTTKPIQLPQDSGKKRKGGRIRAGRPAHTVTIEAVLCDSDGRGKQFWGRLHDDLTQSVYFTDPSTLAAASYACDAQDLGTARRYKRPSQTIGVPAAQPPIADATFNNDRFKASLADLDAYLPTAPHLFYNGGVRLSPVKCPRQAFTNYRRGLSYIARALLNRGDDPTAKLSEVEIEKYWKLLLLYDGLVLGPTTTKGDFADLVHKRCALFLAGDWEPLFREHLSFREATFKPKTQPTCEDPKDALANRAQYILDRRHCVGGASAALRAPKVQKVAFPGQLTSTFSALNPQVGDPSPSPPPGGGDFSLHHSDYHDVPSVQRRPLQPPSFPSPTSIVFTTAEIIKRVRRASTSSAGGLSGTDYRTLRVWFSEPDSIADDLTEVINLVAAGKVPPNIVPLLTAGRGIGIPKNDKGSFDRLS